MAREQTYTQNVYLMSYRLDGRVQFYPIVTAKRTHDQKTYEVKYREGKPLLLEVSYLAFTIQESEIGMFFPQWGYERGEDIYINGAVTYQITDTPLPTCNPFHLVKEPLLWEKVIQRIDVFRVFKDAAIPLRD